MEVVDGGGSGRLWGHIRNRKLVGNDNRIDNDIRTTPKKKAIRCECVVSIRIPREVVVEVRCVRVFRVCFSPSVKGIQR